MTAKKRTLQDVIDFDDSSFAQDFDTFIEDLGESPSTVEIYRMERADRQQLDRVSIDDLKQDVYGYLRERFGVGKYWLKFKSGDSKYRGSKTVSVGSQAKVPETPVAAAAPVQNIQSDFMEKQLTLQTTFMTGMLAAIKPAPPVDMGAMMTGLAAMMTALNSAVPKTDPAGMLQAVSAIWATLTNKVSKDEDYLERFQKMAEVFKNLMPQPHEESWLGVTKDLGKEIINRLPALVAPAGITTTAAAAPAQLPPAPAPPAEVRPVGEKAYVEHIKDGINILKEKAREKLDPGLYVDLMFEESNKLHWNALLGAIQHGATFEMLLQYDPEIAQNPELTTWFKAVYDGVHSNLFEHVDSGGAGGNTGNTSENARGIAGGVQPS